MLLFDPLLVVVRAAGEVHISIADCLEHMLPILDGCVAPVKSKAHCCSSFPREGVWSGIGSSGRGRLFRTHYTGLIVGF